MFIFYCTFVDGLILGVTPAVSIHGVQPRLGARLSTPLVTGGDSVSHEGGLTDKTCLYDTRGIPTAWLKAVQCISQTIATRGSDIVRRRD